MDINITVTLEILKAIIPQYSVHQPKDTEAMITKAQEIAEQFIARVVNRVDCPPTALDAAHRLMEEGKTVVEIKALPLWDELTEAERCAVEGKPFKGVPPFQPVKETSGGR